MLITLVSNQIKLLDLSKKYIYIRLDLSTTIFIILKDANI